MATILITGSSKGIGFETALAFARNGHRVFATMRSPLTSPRLAEVAANEGLPISVHAMDVDSDQSVHGAMDAILAEHPVDVLINNAGIEAIGSVEEQTLPQFRAVMETNYFGAIRCIQAVLPAMRQRRSGCIVNVSSISGRITLPPMASYCASKWALEALSKALAAEAKTFNVRVVLVEPGIIDTDMARRIGTPDRPSVYSQSGRIVALFSHALQQPVPASLVAEKILEVVDSGTWKLRHLVGPDAVPITDMHSRMSDEEWIDMNAADDTTFFARFAEEMQK